MSAALLRRASPASLSGLRAEPRRAPAAAATATAPIARAACLAAVACLAAADADRRQRRQRPSAAAGFFRFGKNGMGSADAGIYAAQGSRDDYGTDDVEHYFNYMGMLAEEGTYDRMEAMLATGTAPVDVLLLMAAKENDAPKVEELLTAGADVGVKDGDGRSPRQLATKPEVLELLAGAESKAVAKA
jgi:hypothetical protein